MSSKKRVIITGIFLIILLTLSLVYLLLPKIEIELKGEKFINLNVGEVYNESGADAYIKTLGKKKKIDIDIIGEVDNKVIGKYIITYRASKGNEKKEIIRIVSVGESEPPSINLKKDVLGCKNNNLIEYELEVIDNYDGNITDKVKYQINNDEIIFSATDSSNNKSEKTVKIKYIDEEKPKIKLKKSATIYLTQGTKYEEYGATAFDSCDGDLTSDIKISHNIDINRLGNYQVFYTVKDKNGIESKIVRNVIVIEEKQDESKKVVNGATIYLTFDDGPGAYTKDLLDLLDKYNVKATFFVTGQFSKYRHLIKEEYERGHSVGIHTYTHKWSIYESVESYFEDFNRIENVIFEETGIHTKLFRFPGGSSNTVSKKYSEGIMSTLSNLLEQQGYIYFDWTFDSGDTNKRDNSVNYIIKNVKANLKGDGIYIVLMHDIKQNTLKALPEIIEFAQTNGYTFDKLTESSPTEHLKIVN